MLFTVATAGVADVHVPPDVVFVKVVVEPIHALVVPPIAANTGSGLTVITELTLLLHPLVVTVYVMVLVPELTPVTTPLALTVATAVLLDVHTPKAVALVKVVVDPAHSVVDPVIDATTGNGFTVTVVTELVALHPVEVTVTLYDVVLVGVTVMEAVVAPVFHK